MRNYITTAKELIEVLSAFPEDTKVVGAWEGIEAGVFPCYDKERNEINLDVDGGWLAKRMGYLFSSE